MTTPTSRFSLHAALERRFPERRVFLRSDTETRYIRLSPLTQLVGVTGTAMLLGWTIIASAILAMDTIGSGTVREQAAREQALYEARLNEIAAERDARTGELSLAQDRFTTALGEISEMQSALLASEERRRELEKGIEIIQATLRRTVQERDDARETLAAMTDGAAPDGTGLVLASFGPADDADGPTLDALSEALRVTAEERDRMASIAAQADKYIEDMQFEQQLVAERNDRIFEQLEQAVTVSMEPLDKVFEAAGLSPDNLIDQLKRARTPTPALSPITFSTKGGNPDPDSLRANAIIEQMDRLDLYRQALEKTPLSLPLKTAFRYSSPFGRRWGRMHEGQDMAGTYGSPIYATADGVVTHAGWENGYGNLVTIRHDFGFETRYGHMSKVRVTEGQRVSRGDRIGDMGNTGRSTGTHLHYEVRVGGSPVNPMTYIKAASNVF